DARRRSWSGRDPARLPRADADRTPVRAAHAFDGDPCRPYSAEVHSWFCWSHRSHHHQRSTGRTMEDLVKRLAVLRARGRLADMCDKRPSKGEFKRPGKAEFKMTSIPAEMLYSMEYPHTISGSCAGPGRCTDPAHAAVGDASCLYTSSSDRRSPRPPCLP